MNKGYYWSLHSMHFCNCLILQADQVHFYSFPARNFIVYTALLTPCLITPPCRTHCPNLKFLLVNGFLIHCSPLSFFYKDRNHPIPLFFFRKSILTSSWITHEYLNFVLRFLWERRRRSPQNAQIFLFTDTAYVWQEGFEKEGGGAVKVWSCLTLLYPNMF